MIAAVRAIAKKWTDQEKEMLRWIYASGRWDVIEIAMRELGRTRAGIACMANQLGISGTERVAKWSDEHIQKISKQRTTVWTDDKLESLRNFYSSIDHYPSDKELSDAGFNPKTCRAVASEMGLSRAGRFKPEKTCQVCGVKFISTKTANRKFCSLKCGYTGRNDFNGKTGFITGEFEFGATTISARSSWEVVYACYLEREKTNGRISSWRHEPRRFVFDTPGKFRSYLPDFEVTNSDGSIEYHEVKGVVTDRMESQFKSMAEQYPEVRLVLRDSKWFFKSFGRQNLWRFSRMLSGLNRGDKAQWVLK